MARTRRTPARRFLAAGARGGNGHGYLSQPQRQLGKTADPTEVVERIATATSLCDEPEAVGPAVIDAQADLARHYNQLRRAAEIQRARETRRDLTLQDRMADAQRRAKDQRIDVSRDLLTIRKMLARHTVIPAAALTRMEAVEARLDGPIELADLAA